MQFRPFAHQIHETRQIDLRLLPELIDDDRALPVDGLEPEPVGPHPHPAVVGQVDHRWRRRAVAVGQFVEQGADVVVGAGRGHAPVDRQALVHVGHVGVGDAEVHLQVHHRPHVVVEIFALQFLDRVFEELHVHLEAHGVDLPALLTTQQIAGAADLEVERGDAEAAAEVAELLDRRQALLRHRRQRLFGRDEHVGVGRTIAAADTSAQLIELRQAVAVGAVDHDGVGVRDVEAVFHDRGREQHVVFVRHEVEHRLLERVFAHLAVADDHARLGHESRDEIRHRVDRLDAVVHEVHLAAAREFRPERPRDHAGVELHDVRLDRQAILRRRLDDRHVADADERHVERARNRRRGERQHVHLLAHLLDAFLVRHAEALLLVHDEQSEVAEDHVFREQAVRAHEDVDVAAGQLLERRQLLALAAEARHHVHAHGERREARFQRFMMLEGEHGRRREDRHLLAVHHRLEGRAHRHFRLAVADIAAEQAIHRRGRFHVALDVGHGAGLIHRQVPRERRFEFFLPVRVGRERVARHCLARGVELQELFGHVAHGLLHARLGLGPRRAAQPIERRPAAARVLLHEVEPLDRHEQLVVAVIPQLEELVRAVADADLLQADELADAVVHVDDEIAHLQVAQVREEGRRRGFLARRTAPLPIVVEEIGLGVDGDAAAREADAVREAADRHEHGAGAQLARARRRFRAYVVVLEHLERALGAAGRVGHEDDGVTGVAAFAQLGDPVGDAAAEVCDRLRGHVRERRGRGVHVECRKARGAAEPRADLGVAHEERVGRRECGHRVRAGAGLFVARLHLDAHTFDRRLHFVRFGDEEPPRLARREVVEHGGGALEVDGQIRGIGRFANGHDHELVERFDRTLRVGIEAADRLHHVAHELDADRPEFVRRVDVEDAAAQTELAVLLHRVVTVVAAVGQERGEALRIDIRVDLHAERTGHERARVGKPRQERRRRHDDDAGVAGGKREQGAGAS